VSKRKEETNRNRYRLEITETELRLFEEESLSVLRYVITKTTLRMLRLLEFRDKRYMKLVMLSVRHAGHLYPHPGVTPGTHFY